MVNGISDPKNNLQALKRRVTFAPDPIVISADAAPLSNPFSNISLAPISILKETAVIKSIEQHIWIKKMQDLLMIAVMFFCFLFFDKIISFICGNPKSNGVSDAVLTEGVGMNLSHLVNVSIDF